MKTVLAEPLTINKDQLLALSEALNQGGNEFVAYDSKPKDEEDWLNRVGDADQLILANTPMPASVIEQSENLKYINIAFTGVDHVPVDLAKEKGIIVSNAAGYSDEGVAEEVIGLSLALLRHFKTADHALRQGGTSQGFLGREIADKTVGIIGTGKIGKRVAELFKAFGCKLLGYNRTERQELKDLGMTYVSLDELLGQSDIVTLHLPHNKETENTITAAQFSLMKPSAIFINCARGPIVNTKDLAEALKNGTIAGAGIDVFDKEPPIIDDPLLDAPNTILLPHVAFFTEEAMTKRQAIVQRNAENFLAGRPIESEIK